MSNLKYVVIGNSTAGIGAVEGIRQIDRHGEIIMITDEPHHTYSRPLISYLLLGKVTEEQMKYRDSDFYIKNNVTLLAGNSVTAIDAHNQKVATSDHRVIPYDKLLVATGGAAFVPSVEGLDAVENKFTFTSLKDAKDLGKTVSKSAKVLIIGAGLIGLKCAEGIWGSVSQITVVDLAPRILSSILDADGASVVQNHLQNKGIHFKLSRSVKRFDQNTATLDNGEVLDFDIVVLAVGVRPSTELLKGIAEIEKGIVINSKAETSSPHIYAAGDCTQSIDISSGQSKMMALLPNAYMQGECAGMNMAGGEKEFKAMPMNAIGFFGLHIMTAGNYNGDVYHPSGVGEGHDCSNYKKLFYSGNQLNGYILIGDVDKAGIYTSLIRERTPLDTLDFDLICKKPGLMAFSKKERSVKLGGGVS